MTDKPPEFLQIYVPIDRVVDVYRFLGGQEFQSQPMADQTEILEAIGKLKDVASASLESDKALGENLKFLGDSVGELRDMVRGLELRVEEMEGLVTSPEAPLLAPTAPPEIEEKPEAKPPPAEPKAEKPEAPKPPPKPAEPRKEGKRRPPIQPGIEAVPRISGSIRRVRLTVR